MPLPTPFENLALAGLDVTVWRIGAPPRLPASTAPPAAPGAGFTVLRVHHAEHRAWRSPVVLLPDSRRAAPDPADWLAADDGGLAAELAGRGHPVWVVGPARALDGAALAHHAEHDLPLAQRLIWGQGARPAFWLGHGRGGTALVHALANGLDPARVAGLVLLDSAAGRAPSALETAEAAPWRRAAMACGRAARSLRVQAFGARPRPAEPFGLHAALGRLRLPALAVASGAAHAPSARACRRLLDGFGGDKAFLPLDARFRRSGPLASPEAAREVWPTITGWLEEHRGHSPERTIRLPSPRACPVLI